MELSIDPDFDPDLYDDPEPRRGRGFLATDINILCKSYVDGDISLDEGKFLTPYTAAKILQQQDGLEKPPSSGAVSRCFKQWEEWGYATFRSNPFAFVNFTSEGRERGLQSFVDEAKNKSA